jgi:hypothetical protein
MLLLVLFKYSSTLVTGTYPVENNKIKKFNFNQRYYSNPLPSLVVSIALLW